jgi:hypothetical protein
VLKKQSFFIANSRTSTVYFVLAQLAIHLQVPSTLT